MKNTKQNIRYCLNKILRITHKLDDGLESRSLFQIWDGEWLKRHV